VTSKASPEFWAHFKRLPPEVQSLARTKFNVWQSDPFHPSLHFKQLYPGLWSVRINIQYRALGLRDGDRIVWFWIGSHAEYDRLIS
jgi:hypothetical protein